MRSEIEKIFKDFETKDVKITPTPEGIWDIKATIKGDYNTFEKWLEALEDRGIYFLGRIFLGKKDFMIRGAIGEEKDFFE